MRSAVRGRRAQGWVIGNGVYTQCVGKHPKEQNDIFFAPAVKLVSHSQHSNQSKSQDNHPQNRGNTISTCILYLANMGRYHLGMGEDPKNSLVPTLHVPCALTLLQYRITPSSYKLVRVGQGMERERVCDLG